MFGEIRSILAKPPSDKTFEELWEVLGQVQDKTYLMTQLIPYCMDRLQEWPTMHLPLPYRGHSSKEVPLWEDPRSLLGTTLDLDSVLNLDSHQKEAKFKQICHSPYLTRITALDLPYNELTVRHVSILLNSQFNNQLTTLRLYYNELQDNVLELLSLDRVLPNLVFLNISNNPLSQPAIDAFKKSSLYRRLGICIFPSHPAPERDPRQIPWFLT